MRNKVFLIAMLSFFSFASFSQKKDLNDIKAVLETFKHALITGDKASLIGHTSPQLSYGHSSGLVETQEQFAEKIASGKSDFVTIDISNETISLYKRTAIVRHTFTATTNDDGKPGNVKLNVLLVFTNEGSGWLLAARQAIKVQ